MRLHVLPHEVKIRTTMTDWGKLTVVKLKDELKRRGLSTSGLKAQLVSRLEEDDSAAASAPQEADVAGGVHVMGRGDDLAAFEFQAGDRVALVVDLDDARPLTNLAAEFGGAVQEDLVVDRPLDLERGLRPRPLVARGAGLVLELFERQELEVPKLLRLAPLVGRADLDGEARRLDRVPHPHLSQDVADRGKAAFADVVAGKDLALQDDDLQVGRILLQERQQLVAKGWQGTLGDLGVKVECNLSTGKT